MLPHNLELTLAKAASLALSFVSQVDRAREAGYVDLGQLIDWQDALAKAGGLLETCKILVEKMGNADA